jgi:glycosyltransferase involved in cell wall biosynthesis
MEDAPPTVAVVITEWNSVRTIRECLSRALHQNYPRDRFSVILVDAGSTDGTLEVAREFESEGLRIEVRPDCTEPEGHRIGVELTSSDIVLFTNSDIYVPPDWIDRHVRWHRQGYTLVGGYVFWGGDKYSFAWNSVQGRQPTFQIEEGAGVGFSNCSVARSTYISAGGIREVPSHHDSEFAFRAVRSGARLVLDPTIEVYHDHPQRALSLVLRRSFGYAYNHMVLVKAFYGGLRSENELPIRLDLPAQVANLMGIKARRAYRERYPTAVQWGIKIGFPEFFFIRQFVRYPAHYLGFIVGFVRRAPEIDSLRDLHRQTVAA